jgi:hypothetical protein
MVVGIRKVTAFFRITQQSSMKERSGEFGGHPASTVQTCPSHGTSGSVSRCSILLDDPLERFMELVQLVHERQCLDVSLIRLGVRHPFNGEQF